MDNVTHALAGALLAGVACQLRTPAPDEGGDATEAFRRIAWPLAIVMAELPDLDLVYSRGETLGAGNLAYMLHHRGHTHTVLVALLCAIGAWMVALAWRRELRPPSLARPLLALSVVAALSHILLDWTNSYGVHPFWPLVNRWFYGDAIFIVEPWLWVLAIPPLLFAVRFAASRVILGALLVVILVAAFRVTMVERGVAVALSVASITWIALARLLPPARRVPIAIAAWVVLEGIFFGGAAAARGVVRRATGPAYRDVVLTPAPGNPLCWLALVVTVDGGSYATTQATVAPVPALRRATDCRAEDDEIEGLPVARRDSPSMAWGEGWSAPVSELRELAATNCEVAAALRFMRTPAWRRDANGTIALFDVRYGGEGSFASIHVRPAATCPRGVPSWTPPRADLLGDVP